MIEKKQKIVFVSHDSSLTGAPILLLDLLKLLAGSDLFTITILLYRGGPLEDEYKKLAPTYVLKSERYSKEKRIVPRAVNYLIYYVRKLIFLNRIKDSDLIINNTVATGFFVKNLHSLHIPVVTYVHEMQSVIETFDKKGGASAAIRFSDYFIVPSQIVGNNLILRHGVSRQNIYHLNSYIPRLPDPTVSKSSMRDAFPKQYGIPNNGFYVVGMGTATHRKGIDIFIDACMEANRYDKNTYFVWVGDFEDADTREYSMGKIKEYGIGDLLKVTGRIARSPLTLFPFDLFVLSSREDPYPLVIIEAAYMKLPAICFEDSGGATQFLSDNCGWVIPSFSATGLAAKIIELKSHPEQLGIRGLNAYRKGMEWHSDEKVILDQFKKIVETVLK